jgi:hypothetical protein
MPATRNTAHATRTRRAFRLWRYHGRSLSAACSEAGIARSTLHRWLRGRELTPPGPKRPRLPTGPIIRPDGDLAAWNRNIEPGWSP